MKIIAPAVYNDGRPVTHPETFAKVYQKALRKFRREPNVREARYLSDEMTDGYTTPDESESASYAVFLAWRAVYGKEE